jgi:RHS repeat-associated protein
MPPRGQTRTGSSSAILRITSKWVGAATSSGTNDGYLTLWIDGTQQANLTGVDNDTWRVDRARLGALSGMDAGTSGTYYFDAFESRRSNYIGPMAMGPLPILAYPLSPREMAGVRDEYAHFTNYGVALQQGSPYTSQPAGTDGVDTYLLNTSPTTNNGTAVTMWVGESNNATDKVARSLIKFDLSSIPSNATITSATISLWTDADFSDNDRTIKVYRLKVPFNESQATWNEASTGVNWQSPGASGTNDRESTNIGSILIDADEPLDIEKQISLSTAQIQEMVNGTFTNNGFIIIADTEDNDRFSYRTSDASAATKRPKLVIQYTTSTPTPTVTNTPTRTPTAGPSPTSTNIFTPTAAPTATQPPQGAFNNATFVYDGDGKRVKSTFNGATTTYFVGAHYEVTGSTITKYYYAGSQRIAMRTGGTLNYLLGDHLGSTSLTTNASGQIVSHLRYKAWGEERYASGTTPTKYQYTGQFSYTADFGLMFYNARWYDPTLGRFAQADTIIPDARNSQVWDRYAYTLNNPIRYIDPSGHSVACPDCGGASLENTRDYFKDHGKHGEKFNNYYTTVHFAEQALAESVSGGITLDELEILSAYDDAIKNEYGAALHQISQNSLNPGMFSTSRPALPTRAFELGFDYTEENSQSRDEGGQGIGNALLVLFSKLGIRTTQHFEARLADWGISERQAFNVYQNGIRYTNQNGEFMIWDSKTKLAIRVDNADYGAITIWEQDQLPSTWKPGWLEDR